MIFVTGNIAKGGDIFKGEFERFSRVIETDDAEAAGNMNISGGAEDRDSVCGGAEADVPDNEFGFGFAFTGGLCCEAFPNAKLANVKKIGLGSRAKPGMHFFAVAGGKKRDLSVGERHKLVVIIIRHASIVAEQSPG